MHDFILVRLQNMHEVEDVTIKISDFLLNTDTFFLTDELSLTGNQKKSTMLKNKYYWNGE